jgi:hypothetical protein
MFAADSDKRRTHGKEILFWKGINNVAEYNTRQGGKKIVLKNPRHVTCYAMFSGELISGKRIAVFPKRQQLPTNRHPGRSGPSMTPLWEPQVQDQSNVWLFQEFYQTVFVLCLLCLYCVCTMFTVFLLCLLCLHCVYCVCTVFTVSVLCLLWLYCVYCVCTVFTVFVLCLLCLYCVYCVCTVFTVFVLCLLCLYCVYLI